MEQQLALLILGDLDPYPPELTRRASPPPEVRRARFTDVLVQNDGDGIMAACPQRKEFVRALIAADQPSLLVVSNVFTLGRSTEGTDLSAQDLVTAAQAETATYGMPGRVVYLAPPPQGVNLGACYSQVSSPAGRTSSTAT